MNEFWVSSGHLLLDRSADGQLLLTGDFLKAFLARPELMPPEEACAAERALHARLLADPFACAGGAHLAALEDADARENWQVFLALRAALTDAPTIEAAYMRLVRDGLGRVPPLVAAQLVHVILRNALHDCGNALVARAAELFFRPQRVSTQDGRVLLADAEAIAQHEAARAASPLLAMLGGPATGALDVLSEANADRYWGRSDAFDMVLDLGVGRAALAEALRIWLRHLLHVDAAIDPVPRIEERDWRWFIGLDEDATRIGNALWHGEAAAEAEQLLALFRLVLDPSASVLDAARDRPIYLLLAMGADRILRLKPQNLVAGLPLAEAVG
ncbi:DUF6352 family protein [Limobrevibacterium gyesilva]|uniref:DUF6352 family protein n=1 Tax=Limobrevibacterium gyesilva TaxID=2991712 RepID=A0AA41YPK4_9PROT|nr:DUF6352 family protein [Limobrevibacterium gyesilva]MCW3474160.1 DUF6352 family protein [Limobrevibacterium gyesilva]